MTTDNKFLLKQRVGDCAKEYLDASRRLLEAIVEYHKVNAHGELTAGALLVLEKAEELLGHVSIMVDDVMREGTGEFDA
jgi:hypothetical protein